MLIVNQEKVFSDIDLDDHEVPPAPKYIETRGFIYIVRDSVFPGFFKLGRTQSLKKRLMQYNDDRPYPTVTYHAFSNMFEDVMTVEKKILERLYKETPPTTFTKEWFSTEHMELASHLINQAEETFTNAS